MLLEAQAREQEALAGTVRKQGETLAAQREAFEAQIEEKTDYDNIEERTREQERIESKYRRGLKTFNIKWNKIWRNSDKHNEIVGENTDVGRDHVC